jgi:hypothetical protein
MDEQIRNNAVFKKQNGYILVAYHKPAPMLEDSFIVPVCAGKACAKPRKGEENASADHPAWWAGMVGDDTGDNISARNGELNECTVLYWAWKNLRFQDFKYVGMFQYRRQLILDDTLYEKSPENLEKKAYKCVHFAKLGPDFSRKIGLSDEAIAKLLEEYDCILPYSSDLAALGIASPYEDWCRRIPGVHVNDLVMLEQQMKRIHPEMAEAFSKYLNSPRKRMYEIFIARPDVASEYCAFLFDVIFKIDPLIDPSLYSVNGKRTLGYLAEILYGFYFTYMAQQGKLHIKECGVSFIDNA